MLRLSPSLFSLHVVGKNRGLINRLAAAREKHLLLTQGNKEIAAASWKLPTDNPHGHLLSWAFHHALSIMLPSAVVTLQKFQHVEITRLNPSVKWPFTLAAADKTSSDEAILRLTEAPVHDFANYYTAHHLDTTGLRVLQKKTQFVGGKSLDDALTVRFTVAAPLPFPGKLAHLQKYSEQEAEFVKNAYAGIGKIKFQRRWSEQLGAPVVEVEWTPRGAEDVKAFIAVADSHGTLQLYGFSPMRQLYLSYVSQQSANALNLLKIRVTGSSPSIAGEAVEVHKDGSRWVSATTATLEAAVATNRPITLLGACACRHTGSLSATVVSTVRTVLAKERKARKIDEAKKRMEKRMVQKAKRKERRAQLLLRRAEKRRLRSEKRKERRAQRAAKRVEKRKERLAKRREKRKRLVAKRAERRAVRAQARAEKRSAVAAKRKERAELVRVRRAEQKKAKAALQALKAQQRKLVRAEARAAKLASKTASKTKKKLKKAAASSSTTEAGRVAAGHKKKSGVMTKSKTSQSKAAKPVASAGKKSKLAASASTTPVATAAPAAVPPATPPAEAVPSPAVAPTTVDL